MTTLDRLEQFGAPPVGSIVMIGNFDGVHRGHRSIVDAARELAQPHAAPVVAITFEPHPIAILSPGRVPQRLTTASEKIALLERFNVSVCITLRTDAALLSREAEDFLEAVVRYCRPRAFVEGPDFNFGRGRRGSVETLRAFGASLNYIVRVVPAATAPELHDAPRISSSAIRASLLEGAVERARAMLGRPYRITGAVGSGAGRGASLGFPTANLDAIPHMLPGAGVYAAIAQLETGELRPAAVNIGAQPTFDQPVPRVEAHLLDFAGDLREKLLGLHVLTRLRGQQKFSDVESLRAQLARDIEQTREIAEAATAAGIAILPLA